MLHWMLLSLFAAQIQLGRTILDVEIAETPRAQARGFMGRDQLPENSGMLFVFEKSAILDFWMNDTSIPLAVGFFDETRAFIHSVEMTPKSTTIHSSKKSAKYALEVNAHWFRTHRIRPGMKFYFKDQGNEIPSLSLGDSR